MIFAAIEKLKEEKRGDDQHELAGLFHRLKKNVNKIYWKIFSDRENYF
jgi:hypothetical protein